MADETQIEDQPAEQPKPARAPKKSSAKKPRPVRAKKPKGDDPAVIGAATLPLKPVERTAGHPDAPK